MAWKILKKMLKLLAKQAPSNQLRVLLLRRAGYVIGHSVYIGEGLIIVDELEEKGNVFIGDRVAIAPRATIVTSSYPNESKIRPLVSTSSGPVRINDDAWIGTGAIILPNLKIGNGAVVGAGAVVTKDVPDYTVVAGVPAKPLGKIDEGERAGLKLLAERRLGH